MRETAEQNVGLYVVTGEDDEESIMLSLENSSVQEIDGELCPVVFMCPHVAREIALGMLEVSSRLDPLTHASDDEEDDEY